MSTTDWLIIGAGVSGLGAAKLLTRRGHRVRVSERTTLRPDKAQAFLSLGVDLKDGGHAPEHLDQVDRIVLSPGLPADHALVAAARARGLPMVSEIDLALGEGGFRGRLIAVTGTNGKSTTCAMLGHVLAKRGLAVSVGGNFGDPPTAMLADGRIGDWLVLELSSYQLEQAHLVAADAAIFTSFSHDHLARHGTMAAYLAAKWRVFANQPKGGVAVLPDYIYDLGLAAGHEITAHLVRAFKERSGLTTACGDGFAVTDAGLATARGETIPLASIGVRERQNQLNAGFTLAALSYLLRVPIGQLAPDLAGFRGLPHRCEPVGTVLGHAVINDSKSTNVESTLVALASQDQPVLLLMGGQGKGEPYGPVLDERAKIAAVVTFGASGPEIARDLRGALTVYEFPTLKAALAAISGILKKHPHGVLFSPGCASFDEFNNYEERGDFFRRSMARLEAP